MKTLNERYDYGLDLFLLSIDEGITGYRDDSLETVKQNSEEYGLPLKVLGYNELYGWTMDDIVKSIGRKNNCTFCGVFRRQALDRGAAVLGVDHIVTGHNADDIAETVLMNVLRGDISRLSRCTEIVTQSADADPSQGCGGTVNEDGSSSLDFLGIKRSKPFKYAYEKEIVLYAYFKSLTYFSTECIYSPNAYRGYARAYLKDLESIRPSAIIDIIHSGEALKVGWREEENGQESGEGKQSNAAASKGQARQIQQTCKRCGYITSNELCKACVLLEGLNKGVPNLGIKSSVKVGGGNESNAADTAANRAQPRPTTAMLRAAASAF
jgi:cytoplasmic tRNA 2-thiolation protein 1